MSDASPLEALITRVERLEAIHAITELSAAYSRGADHRDLDLFSSVWTNDAEWAVSRELVFTGLAAIREAISRQWQSTRQAVHWTSNPSIDVDVTTATATARWDVHTNAELLDSTWLMIGGTYHDAYIRSDDGWKLTRRSAEVHFERRMNPSS
jgi:hypothetical protein